MKNKIISLLLGLGLILSADAGPPIWNLDQSPTSEILNGISAANNFYAMGVGENGSIIEFINGDSGSSMVSGTDKDLYDVFVASQQLALASGEDIVLLWDGSDWQPVVESATNTFFTGTWITPEKDFAFYQSLGFFNFICPHEIGAAVQGFCRGHSTPMLAMCGASDDIKLIMADGNILHYNNQLGEFEGIMDPLHEQISPLNLTGVYVPKTACLPGPFKPRDVFAINNTDEFFHFDGDQWVNMGVSVPNDQTLTWLNGSGSNNIVATGFKPDGMSGNEGVIWVYDGSTWAEDTNLPLGTPGLTDVAVNLGLVDGIFTNGFDAVNKNLNQSDVKVDILAAAESGKKISSGAIFPLLIADLSISKKLLNSEPIRKGDTIIFQLTMKNNGPSEQLMVYFNDNYVDTIQFITDTCDLQDEGGVGDWNIREAAVTNLAVGQTEICTVEFFVSGEVGEEIKNFAIINSETGDDPNTANNFNAVSGIIIQSSN